MQIVISDNYNFLFLFVLAYSLNPEYYGYYGVHNTGHVLISLVLDPVQELGLPPGVMGDTATVLTTIFTKL